MIVLILESVPQSLRGELSKWMLEPQAGVFVGNVSGAVRELLWEKVCKEAGEGSCVLVQSAANEQGYSIRTWGESRRKIESWEGLFLVRRPIPASKDTIWTEPADWQDSLHLDLWAKTPRGVELTEGEGGYHPLICHMIDSAMVAMNIWELVISPSLKNMYREQLGVETNEDAAKWLAFFVGLHDIGKATPIFAKQWDENWTKLVNKGFTAPKSHEKISHDVLTTALLDDILTNILRLNEAISQPISFILGAHHGLFPDYTILNSSSKAIGSGIWSSAQEELVRVLAHVLDLDLDAPPTGDLSTENGLLMIFAGLTCTADWIASNHDCFKYAGEKVQLDQYLKLSQTQARNALHTLGWLSRPDKKEVIDFSELFGDKLPNQLQAEVIDIAYLLDSPSLVLLEYPMGGGKTEASLWLADYLGSTLDQQGIYFALPTMATSNQMFGRVSKYLENRYPESDINTMLLHGHASLNAEFETLLRKGQHGNYNVNSKKIAGLRAAEWFTYRKRGLLAPFGIGTIDQALLAVLQSKHFFVRLFGLSGKVIILDEVHAYDSYMKVLLERMLSWLAVCNASVILLSATLPSNTRQSLLKAYALGRGRAAAEMPQVSYPRLSWVSASCAGSRHVGGAKKRNITITCLQGDGWVEELQSVLEGGGCAAVILNTVGTAQAAYQKLQHYFNKDEIFLFHARFPFDIRMQLEESILHLFGPNGERPYKSVVVATQVIEQSLDLDFDLMVTELAPVDLVFQRSGRVWRHNRPRPNSIQSPMLWILMPEEEDGVPLLDSPTSRVYEPHTLLRSWLVLQDKSLLEIPGEIENMVEAVYSEEDPPQSLPGAIRETWMTTLKAMKRRIKKDQGQARKRYVPDINADILSHSFHDLHEDEEENHVAFQALTRLSGPSVTAVCLIEEDGRLWTVGDARRSISLVKQPNQEEVRALLGSSIRLSFSYTLVQSILEIEPPATWQANVHLRRCRVLRFDPEGHCVDPELLQLRLNPILGLYVE